MDRTLAIVERLAVNEEKVMELYSVFGDIFPEHGQFWKGISGEEKQHARMLREFGTLVDDKDIKLDLNYIKTESLEESIIFLSGEIDSAKNRGMDCKQAFKLARTLEKGIVESECFKIFNSNVKDLVKLFGLLQADTKRHCQMMDEKCEIICKK
jgi:hypothetical protein